MADSTYNDKRVDALTKRLQEELVDEEGHPAEPDNVRSVVEAKAATLAEAPVQEFTPLLIEHQAKDELRQHGLRRDLGQEPDDAPPIDADDETVL